MSQSAESYEMRAQECARLANLTSEPMVQAALLSLRQNYLHTARELKNRAVAGGR